MKAPLPSTIEFLLQLDVVGDLLPNIGKKPWQTLYLQANDSLRRIGMWCALLDDNAAASAIRRDAWDLLIGHGTPSFSQSWTDGEAVTTYHRFGSMTGVRPLILLRSFDGAFPDYLEVDEEFRLFHNLAEDKGRGLLLSFDSSGREIEIVKVTQREIQARLKQLRQFQAGTGLHLAIYLDSVRYSEIPLSDVNSSEQKRVEITDRTRWCRTIASCDFRKGFATLSRLLAKVIIAPPSRDKAGIWPFATDDGHKEVTFITGVDDEGNEVEHSSDPDKLDNYFDANLGAASYLTPIYFRREVLTEYFAEPDRYKVSDGRLSCLSLWSCQIDNDLASHVVVFLGDLGRYLPFEERLHWRQFNVAPEGGVSETSFRRSFLGQFADAQAPDLRFKSEYAHTIRAWATTQGWALFLAPSPSDSHLLETVRIPITNSQAEFDE